MKKILLVLVGLMLVGAGCGSATIEEPVVHEDGRSTATQYHIETAASDLRNAVDDTVGDTLDPYHGFISFAQMTLPSAIELAEDDGLPELAEELRMIDQDLTEALAAATTQEELVVAANAAASQLEAL